MRKGPRNSLRILLVATGIVIVSILLQFYLQWSRGITLFFEIPGIISGNETTAVLRAVSTDTSISLGSHTELALILDTSEKAVNAIEGTITFPTDSLRLVSIATSSSVIQLWIEEPAVRKPGSISFSGILLDGGFTGSDGLIFSVSFESQRVGPVTIDVTDAQVLAADGKGTNVLEEVVPLSLRVLPSPGHGAVDLNGDGVVTLSDVSVFIGRWVGSQSSSVDINGDGASDLRDLSILLSKMFQE